LTPTGHLTAELGSREADIGVTGVTYLELRSRQLSAATLEFAFAAAQPIIETARLGEPGLWFPIAFALNRQQA
jgi:hypothetical protein